ncbi:Do family serine endopeptidase [Altericroceibacterium xinjiangense]|uniref:Do family serine endopeptidase n=1 Tax=Altericroceibacterium xinjiangense TaxID=762261 RepID=UPI0019CF6B75|nr:Do family serine endopeptidase [Altericroceibacterium xinjiangense]
MARDAPNREEQEDVKPVRYSYGITSVLLAGGAAVTLITGIPAGAQVAQNDESQINRVMPRGSGPASFADLTAQLQPAVVNIATRQRVTVNTNNPFAGTPLSDLFGGGRGGQPTTREAQSLGSGFIISADGYVVTNNHVITAEGQGEVEEITVTMPDGTEFPAELVGNDAASDLAVLKIQRGTPFPFVRFGDSTQSRVGDWVVAIGNPFGLGGTVTAGIISAVYRATNTGGAYDRYIQTDAAINRGNSGGPLFDMEGNVIGINNAIFSPSGGSVGIGFAIPADIAAPIVRKLIAGEEIERGYLGVRIQPVTDDVAAALGIPRNRGEFIQSVQPGEAADLAGLQAGDVVVSVNGEEITPDQTLSFLVANIAPGTTVPVQIIRDGRRQNLNVRVGERPTEEELARQVFNPDSEATPGPRNTAPGVLENSLGVQGIALTPEIAPQLGISAGANGVVVTAVDPSSDAGQKGLQRGDVILSANYRDVASAEQLESVIAQAKSEGRDAVLLRVQRRGQPPLFLPVRLR